MEEQNKDEYLWIGEYVLDEQGNPRPEHDVLAWAQWYETAARQIALTRFKWGRVSTIFLGLDQDYFSFCWDPAPDPPNYKPLVWETMVFGGKLDQQQRRYRSREEALAGHDQLVEECKAAQEKFLDRICWKAKPRWEAWIWKNLYGQASLRERGKRLGSWWWRKWASFARRMLIAIRRK
jgi:hypothetical protein